jgi:hypothetical protein
MFGSRHIQRRLATAVDLAGEPDPPRISEESVGQPTFAAWNTFGRMAVAMMTDERASC